MPSFARFPHLLAVACLAASQAHATVTAALSGFTITVSITGANETATVKPSGGNIRVFDSLNTMVYSGSAANVALVVQGDGSPGQAALFPLGVVLDESLDVAGVESAQFSDVIGVGGADFHVDASRTVQFTNAIVQATGASINISGNVARTSFPAFQGSGVSILNSAITTDSGNIQIQGYGGALSSGNNGVSIVNSQLTTTAHNLDPILFSGGLVISLSGIGGAEAPTASDGNLGILLDGASTIVNAFDGSVQLDGGGARSTSASNTSNGNYGVSIQNGAQVFTVNGTIVLVGHGGGTLNGGTHNDGINISAGVASPFYNVQANNGAVILQGDPGFGTSRFATNLGGSASLKARGVGHYPASPITGFMFQGDSLNVDPTVVIDAGTTPVAIFPQSTFMTLGIGSADGPGVLGVSNAEVQTISAGSLIFGQGGSTSIAVTSPVSTTSPVTLMTGAGVQGPSQITTPALTLQYMSGGPVPWTIGPGMVQLATLTPLLFNASVFSFQGVSTTDTLDVTPSPSTTMNIDGADPTGTTTGDTLNIHALGLITPSLTSTHGASGYFGSMTFGNAQPVNFQNIELGTVAPASVSVSIPTTVQAGVPFNVTVTMLDPIGNTASSYTGTIHFTSSDGLSILPADSTLTNGTVTLSATLRTLGSQSVFAADTLVPGTLNGNAATIVLPGPATHFSVSAPASDTAGNASSIAVTALDQFNNVATGYAGTVHFTSTDGQAILPADSTLAGGVGTFGATLKTAGSQTVSATDTVSAATGTTAVIAIGPAATTRFDVSAPASATAGVASSFTVTARDPFNNVGTNYAGTVHFTSTDSAATLPADAALSSGVGTLSATLKTSGSQTLTATDTVSSVVNGTSGAITVNAASATHVTVSAPSTAASGAAFSITVTAFDAFNNIATAYAGTLHFTSSDGTAVLPANATLAGGTGTFSATLNTAGTQSVTATDTVSSAITATSGAISVSAAAATHFTVSAPASATAGVASSFTVTALDAFNNTAIAYSGTVHFTSTDGQAVLPANATLASGVGTFSATLKTSGSQVITATDTVSSSITGSSAAIAVSSAAATHLTVSAPAAATAGAAFSITITALDAFNNTASTYAGTVHVTSSDGAAVLPADSALTSGVGTFSATLRTSGSRTITAADTVTPSISGTSGAITVAGSAATHFSVSAPASTAGNVAFGFSVTALDQFNNTATAYAGTVHFTSSDTLAVLPADSTLASGVGTFSATLKTAGTRSVTATDTVSAAVTGTASINVVLNTYSAPSATGTGTITATFTGGGATCSFAAPQFIGAPPGSPPVPPSLPEAGTLFPQGMFDFSLTGCTPGSTITMTITYPNVVTGMRYWKYGPEAANHTPHWYVMPATLSGNTAVFSITDGGQGDDDLTANGVIDDQGGPGSGSNGVPTMSWWMLLLMALGLVAVGWRSYLQVPVTRS